MKKTVLIATGLVLILSAVGCNVGMGEAGPSPEAVKKQIDGMPPEKQISLIRNSPMPKAEQDTRVAEICKKYGITEGASSTPSAPIPGTPGR